MVYCCLLLLLALLLSSAVKATSATLFRTLLPHLDDTDYAHPQTICHVLFRSIQGQSSENVRSLSLARQLATHYRMTFAKSQTPIHLSAI